MTESLPELLEKMRASRAALRHELDQVPARAARRTLTQRALTSKGLNTAVAVVFAVAILLTRRRR
jgi:hypothetical protein